jgi:serine/threonine protein kinase
MGNRYGRYEVLYKLGQGAMAEVHLARDPVLSRFVAIKVLKTELATRKDVLQRFFNEARIVAVVRNPHVVEVFDFGQEGNDLYLVMEFVDGQSLQGILKQLRLSPRGSMERDEANPEGQLRDQHAVSEPLDTRVTAALICQAAEGLTVAARHGVVHRDIKPENLMLNQQGYLKISDFGIAHVQDDNLTKTGAILGSPLYMSPEQARGLKPITSQADMFSLGAVFYTCLAGHPPFRGKSFSELFRKIATEPHTPLWRLRPELDPNLSNLVDALLNKDPRQRGGGPQWLHKQLKGYLMTVGVSDPAELVCGYLQTLTARGVQTTWRSEGPVTTVAHTRNTIRFSRDGKRTFPAGPVAAGALGLALLAGGAWFGLAGKSAIEGGPAHSVAAVTQGGLSPTPSGSPPKVEALTYTGIPKTDAPKAPDTAAIGLDSIARTPDSRIAAEKNPAAKSPAAKSGEESTNLILQSSPPFAETFVDGHFVGITPVTVEVVPSERHRIVMKGKHLPTLDTMLTFRPGNHSLKFKLDYGPTGRIASGQTETP